MDVFNMLPEGALCEVVGNVIYMFPSRSTTHQSAVGDIVGELFRNLKQNMLAQVFMLPCDVYLDSGETVLIPDISITKADRAHIIEKKGIKGSPDVIIEVLSEDINHDKVLKFGIYERNAVPEYIIVDPETKQVWQYMLTNGAYVLQAGSTAGKLSVNQFGIDINF